MEQIQQPKTNLTRRLVYAVAGILFGGTILGLIMLFFIPKYEIMHKEMELGTMPVTTEIFLATANTITEFWYLLVLPLPVVAILVMRKRGKDQPVDDSAE